MAGSRTHDRESLRLAVPASLALVAEPLSLLVWVWVVFSVVFMGPRCLVLVARSRGEAWLVTGVPAGRR